jgi:hypothetical protein
VASREKAVLKLQKEILAAQVAQAILVVRTSNLEKQLARFAEAEKERSDRQSNPAPHIPIF